jgi:CheY-like chemotaxis protein
VIVLNNLAHSILLIDDDPEDCFIMQEHLLDSGWNHPILMANDGTQGIKLLKSLADTKDLPIVILMDINMPKMDGFECLSNIKKDFPEISVIIYSTACSDEHVQTALKLGAHNCITKPSSYSDGLDLAKKIIDIASTTQKGKE